MKSTFCMKPEHQKANSCIRSNVSKCFSCPVFLLCILKTIYTVIRTYMPLLLGQYQTTCHAFSLTVLDTFVGYAFHCMFTMNVSAVWYFYCAFARPYTQSSEHICHYYLDRIKLHVMHLVWQCWTHLSVMHSTVCLLSIFQNDTIKWFIISLPWLILFLYWIINTCLTNVETTDATDTSIPSKPSEPCT